MGSAKNESQKRGKFDNGKLISLKLKGVQKFIF
jgi:hypothetical protein